MSIDHQYLGLMNANPMCDVELMIIDLYKTWHTIFPEVWFTIGCERNGAEVITVAAVDQRLSCSSKLVHYLPITYFT